MIQAQLKLRLTKAQERELETWLVHLGSVYNWAVRKIELNAKDRIYFKRYQFRNILAGHSERLGVPSHVIQGVLLTAYDAWDRCFKRLAGQPRLKGKRNCLSSIPFPDPIARPTGNRIKLLVLPSLRFHRMEIPEGKIKCSRVVKRSSGWYLCLFIDANSQPIDRVANGAIGIDAGFKSLLTTSSGEVVEHPREFEAAQARLRQAQRGKNKQLAARLQERIRNRRKDRNHKLARRLVAENVLIAFSKDRSANIARRFGKSVSSSSHHQLRRMLSYKAASSGCEYIEVESRNSTKTCSACGALSGPSGLAMLAVRQWICGECGESHDRDVNAAVNTYIVGVGLTHERFITSETSHLPRKSRIEEMRRSLI